TSDPRMKALAAASTALAGYNAYQSVTKAPDKIGGIGINVSLGSSKSKSTSTQTSDTAAASTLSAGRDITITATPSPPAGEGRGEGAGDITVQGADLSAGRHLTLAADDEIRLLAAKNTFEQHSSNKSSSASLGVGYNTASGFSVTASASQDKGKADGADVSHSNTHATAGDTLTLQSGGDAALRGAVARGERVIADIGGSLAIDSLQDSSTYKSKQQNAGFSVSVSLTGGLPGGSVSAGQSKVKSDYASVTEQSAIRAGDGGFDVAVAGDTALTGGAITSTQQAINENRNRFETGGELALSDIQNKAEYSAKSVSVSLGAGFSSTGELTPQGTGAGFGKDSGDAGSTTLAAISGIAGNTQARTGDAETGLAPIFDQQKVQKEIDAQVAITQIFGQLASKAVGDYAQAKLNEAQALRDQGREQEAKDIESLWGANGTLRLAAHTLIGGLTGGVQGAAGAAVGTLTAPFVAAELAKAGIDGPLATAITALASTAAGAAAGGAAGGATAFNEVGNNFLKHQEATRLIALRNQKLRGECSADCENEIRQLEALDVQRNRDLAACEGVASSHCDGLRTEVRQAAAEYIRAGRITPEFRYDDERRETLDLAANSMGGIRLADRLAGAGESAWEGVTALASGIVTGARALLGERQAQEAVRQGAGAAWDYVSNPENWPTLLGAMTPEDREKLAAAYETGDARTIGRMLGAQAANMPAGSGGLGTVKRVGNIVDAAEDAAKAAKGVVAKGLPTPTVSDPKLSNLVSDLYKGAKGPNPIGTGSTADAIRNELATGLPTHGTFHSQKGEQYIDALNNWLRKNPDASYQDRLVAESLKRDLQNALGRE
ncbi:MAG: hemagglutinin repeat-containing protein, partial [Sterolibacterium sp.]